ncbi:hypothetical protein [Burkholderia sp. 9120]|nr:hypothetical protein [Burkholderia sp. 9120]
MMSVAYGFGVVVGIVGVVAIRAVRVVFRGGKGNGPVGSCRPQRGAMGGMSDIREKMDKLSCCSAFHYTPPHCTNNFRNYFNSMPGSALPK